MNDTKNFQYYISKYFTTYLHAERNMSTHTIASYADTDARIKTGLVKWKN